MPLYEGFTLCQDLKKAFQNKMPPPAMSANNAESERIVNDPRRGFLGHLAPSVIKQFPYRSREQFVNNFRHAVDTSSNTSEWLMVTGVNSEVFDAEFRESQTAPFSSWCAFGSELGLLLIKMVPSTPREVASETLNVILHEALIPAGMHRTLTQLGRTPYFAPIGVKIPDKAWRPHGRTGNWPSVVLEVADSETAAKLQGDIRYWHRASGGDVRIVLALEIDQRQPRVTIEKWDTGGDSRKHLEQRIVISRTAGQITIHGGPLTIEFENLFLRPREIAEKDIELDEERLGYIATQIWNQQTF